MVVVAPDAKPHLRTWLVRTLEPICDADPGALADYVSALLDRDESETELRSVLAGELDEFLEKDGPSFLDQLFNVLRTKSYIPYAATADAGPSKGAEPMQTDSSGVPPNAPTSPRGSRKRPLEDDGSERPPPKGPRLGNHMDGRFPPFGPAAMNGAGVPGHTNPNRRQGDPKVFINPEQMQGICRDYHVKGFCARGAVCKFTHDADAVQPMVPMPFPPQFAGMPQQYGGPGMEEGYNPMNPRMDGSMQNMGYAPGMGRYHYTPRPAIANRNEEHMGPGELPVIQDLTPKAPANEGEGNTTNGPAGVIRPDSQRMDRPQRVPRFNNHMALRDRPSHVPNMYGGPAMHGMHGPMGMGGGMMMEVDNNMSMMAPGGVFPNPHQFHQNMPFGGPQGTFVAPAPGFNGAQPAPTPGAASTPGARPTRREDKTLVVEKIPTEKLSIEAVTGWFQRFGSVTNVAIDRKGCKALVSFEEHQDARAAWKAEDAVFGNRFVKVFWHRPMEGHGALGQKMLAASASAVSKATAAPSGLKAAESDRQPELETLVTEQKALMAKVSALTGEEKKATFAELREVGAKIKEITAGAAAKPAASATADEEKRKMEQLDRELDSHAEGPKDSNGGEAAASSETEALKAQLAKLKAEAESLGIDPANPTVHPTVERGGYSGFRGRGRGRGARGYALRGGAFARGGARASMKLDNRPKVLRISGVSPDKVQGVCDWYEAAGGMDKLDVADNGDLLVYFKSRGSAEQGLAKGMKIPTVGSVGVTWHTGPASSAASAAPRVEHDEPMHDTMDDVDELGTSSWNDNPGEGAGAI